MDKHKFNIFPEMLKDEFDNMMNDIKINGYNKKYPIIIFEEKILDGWNRQKACDILNVIPNYETFLGNNIDAINFVMQSNKRRNLTSSQWACVAVEADEIIEAIKKDAKERQAEFKGNQYKSGLVELIPQLQNSMQNKSSQKIADIFNTNEKYIRDAEKIKNDNPESFEKIKSGEKTITEVKKEEKRKSVIAELEDIGKKEIKKVSGIFDVIVIDPPWTMKKIERDCAPEQVEFDYPTMSIEDIKNLKIPTADNCHVWLWTTQKYLPDSFEILNEWGLKYVCCFVWHKNGGFQAFGLPQYNCEFVLYARKGTPEFIDFKNFNTCFDAKRTGHSEKPEEFYDIVRRVTAGRRLDMFNRRAIDGFETYGLEAVV